MIVASSPTGVHVFKCGKDSDCALPKGIQEVCLALLLSGLHRESEQHLTGLAGSFE